MTTSINLKKGYNVHEHPYHLVDESPCPLITSIAVLTTTVGGVLYMHGFKNGLFTLLFGLIFLVSCMTAWWQDVVCEATYEGHHTSYVQKGLRYGMILFIVSEVMFFVAFFWAFFHSSLAPAIQIGAIWPPKGIHVFNPWEVPFLNTLILLLSGASVTWAHYALVDGNREDTFFALLLTVGLGFIFTCFQIFEYVEAPFTMADGIYGSVFYMATGFHGFHVLIGTTFLIVCLVRHINYHFTPQHHFGFEAAAWYWHFVDVVWLFLFISIYWWGS